MVDFAEIAKEIMADWGNVENKLSDEEITHYVYTRIVSEDLTITFDLPVRLKIPELEPLSRIIDEELYTVSLKENIDDNFLMYNVLSCKFDEEFTDKELYWHLRKGAELINKYWDRDMSFIAYGIKGKVFYDNEEFEVKYAKVHEGDKISTLNEYLKATMSKGRKNLEHYTKNITDDFEAVYEFLKIESLESLIARVENVKKISARKSMYRILSTIPTVQLHFFEIYNTIGYNTAFVDYLHLWEQVDVTNDTYELGTAYMHDVDYAIKIGEDICPYAKIIDRILELNGVITGNIFRIILEINLNLAKRIDFRNTDIDVMFESAEHMLEVYDTIRDENMLVGDSIITKDKIKFTVGGFEYDVSIDFYVAKNGYKQVMLHHVAPVRGFVTVDGIFFSISCLRSIHERCVRDYRYFASKTKSADEIVIKYWDRGYHPIWTINITKPSIANLFRNKKLEEARLKNAVKGFTGNLYTVDCYDLGLRNFLNLMDKGCDIIAHIITYAMREKYHLLHRSSYSINVPKTSEKLNELSFPLRFISPAQPAIMPIAYALLVNDNPIEFL